MALTISKVAPETITAGNTLQFTIAAGEYDPATYTVTYRLISTDNTYTVTATDNGDGTHLVEASAATTSAWAVGEFTYYLTATSGTDRHTMATGLVKIMPDPGVGGFDGRTHIKKTLDALEAVLESRASSDQLGYSIGGRSISKMAPEQLLAWHDKYKALYAQEKQAERLAQGLGSSRKIKVRIK